MAGASGPPQQWVSYDRWYEAHQAVIQRVAVQETRVEAIREAEQEHQVFRQRLAVLEQTGRDYSEGENRRRDRIWVILIAIMSGVVLPLLLTALISYLHLSA